MYGLYVWPVYMYACVTYVCVHVWSVYVLSVCIAFMYVMTCMYDLKQCFIKPLFKDFIHCII